MRLVCLMIRLKPSVRASWTSSRRAVMTAGHQAWIVQASRVAFRQLGADRSLIETDQPPPDLRRLLLSEQQAETFLHRPGGLNLLGRVTGVQAAPQPLPLLTRQALSAGQQEPPAHPDRIPDRAARERVTRCLTSVTIVFASATRCHLSIAIFTPGRTARIPDAYGAEGSTTTISIRRRNASGCSPSQSLADRSAE
jgi:hypothetical protein